MHALLALAEKVGYRARSKTFYVCYGPHPNDPIYAENLLEFFREAGMAAEAIRLQPKNPQRELLRCLNDLTLGVIGLNVQLDHSWIDSDNFLDLASAAEVPVLHWILDHTSSRWRQFTKATAQNSRFVFLSPFSEQYFRRYALPGSLTACTVNTGPSHRSRIPQFTRDEFLARDIACLIPINLRRIGGSFEDAMLRRQALDRRLARAVDIACEQAYYDLDGPLESHLENALADASLALDNSLFNDAFQIVEDVVQIRRRQRIFEIARAFPVLIQSDESAAPFASGGKARFETNVSMQTTLARMKSARAVLSASRVNDEIHNRIAEWPERGLRQHHRGQCREPVRSHGRQKCIVFQIIGTTCCASTSTSSAAIRGGPTSWRKPVLRSAMRRSFRFGGFHNIIELARTPFLAAKNWTSHGSPSLAL